MAAWHQLIRIVRRLCVPSRLGLASGGFTCQTPCALRPPIPTDGQPSFPRPSITQTGKYRNINLSSIGCALRPGLRVRLTLGGRTCPRNPWIFGGRDSHPPYRYSCLHGHSSAVHRSFRPGFNPADNALLPFRLRGIRGFGSKLSPDHLRRGITRPVSYYAFFK